MCSDVGSLNLFFVPSVIFKCSSNVQISLVKAKRVWKGSNKDSGSEISRNKRGETAAYLPVALQLTGLYEHVPPKCSLYSHYILSY